MEIAILAYFSWWTLKGLKFPKDCGRSEIQDFSDNGRYFVDLLARLLRKDVATLNLSHSFTRLGGDSVLAIRLSAKLRDQGIQLSSNTLLGKLCIQDIAKALVQERAEMKEMHEAVPLEGEVPLAPMQCRFLDLELSYPHHYNQSLMLVPNFSGDVILDTNAFHKSLVQLAEHHDMLRASCPDAPWKEPASADGNKRNR